MKFPTSERGQFHWFDPSFFPLMHGEVVRRVRVLLPGQPYSKENSRELVMMWKRTANGGKTKIPRLIKSKRARAYVDAITAQVRPLPELIAGQVRMIGMIYYETQRPDLDESLIMDILQGVIYQNDRQVREKHIYHAIDKHNPRAEIVIEEIAIGGQKELSL